MMTLCFKKEVMLDRIQGEKKKKTESQIKSESSHLQDLDVS